MREEQFTDKEKETLVLKACVESINTMLNYEVIMLAHNDPDSSIKFKTSTHQKYFNIILLDFLHSKVFGIEKNCVDALQDLVLRPCFNQDVALLKSAAVGFKIWLDEQVEFDHDGETRKLWFPSIDKEVALKIRRVDFIKICGNISKHNLLGLSYQGRLIQDIFKSNNIEIELTQALLIMEEFYEQFHNDLFSYHSSTIAEFLNNIRWGIFEYMQPLYKKSVKPYWNEKLKLQSYRYNYPMDIKNPFIRAVFWDLLNEIRSEPYMPKFIVTRYLKMRY